MIISRDDGLHAPESRRRRLVPWKRLIAAPLLFAAGGLVGAYVVHDGVAREWIRQSAYKVVHAGNYARGVVSSPQLEQLRIDMGDGSLAQVRRSRREAMAAGILVRDDEPWVSATFGIGDASIRARMRLKGLMNNHRDTQKWSYRIAMPDDEHFLGMTAFSIQHPGTRGFLDEWLYRQFMKSEGLLAPRYDYVNVTFNGSNMGIYAVEEHVSSRAWLETQQRRDGIILRLDDTEIWRHRLALGMRSTVYAGGFRNNPMHDFRSGRNERNEIMRDQRDAAIRLLVDFTTGKRSASEVFDVELTARFLALHELWSCSHVLGPPNARFYFNTVTGRLEPIAGDVQPEFHRGPFLVCFPTYDLAPTDKVNSVFWPPLFLSDPVTMEAYVRELVRVSQPVFLEQLRSKLHDQETHYLYALWREYPQVQRRWRELGNRQQQLRDMLDVELTAIAYGQLDEHGLAIDIGNPLRLPVEVLGIEVDGHWIDLPGDERMILPGRRFDEPVSYVRLDYLRPAALTAHRPDRPTPYERAEFGISDGSFPQPIVRLHTQILGNDKEVVVEARMGPKLLRPEPGLPEHTTIAEALERYEFLELAAHPADESVHLRIRPGTWEIEDDFVLPHGTVLEAGPGTTLRFAPDAVMLAAGPIELRGDADAPVVLEPTGDSWPGIIVLQARQPSVLEHVHIRQTHGIDRDGRFFTGGVTFYESPVAIVQCLFDGSIAEDALNTIRSTFDLRETTFRNTISDALDGDFCEGVIVACRFLDIGGDAIDVSGSRISIYDVTAIGIGDKAISTGEDSHMTIDGLTIERARFGIVSKDLSSVRAENVEIRESDVGIAAFVKKPFYGPALASASNVRLHDVKHETLVQTGSRVTLNGQEFLGSPLDVRLLYAAEEQGQAPLEETELQAVR